MSFVPFEFLLYLVLIICLPKLGLFAISHLRFKFVVGLFGFGFLCLNRCLVLIVFGVDG